jgi:hypothetical protein
MEPQERFNAEFVNGKRVAPPPEDPQQQGPSVRFMGANTG